MPAEDAACVADSLGFGETGSCTPDSITNKLRPSGLACRSRRPADSKLDLLDLLIPSNPPYLDWRRTVVMVDDQSIADLQIPGIRHLHH